MEALGIAILVAVPFWYLWQADCQRRANRER